MLKEGKTVGLANHTVLITKDGKEVPIDDSGAPIKQKDGKISGVVLVFRDITERKKRKKNCLTWQSFRRKILLLCFESTAMARLYMLMQKVDGCQNRLAYRSVKWFVRYGLSMLLKP